MEKLLSKRNGLIFVLVLALIMPFIVPNEYILHVLALVCIWSISVYGINIFTGYTGNLSLAHVGFFAIGAYTLGLLTVKAEWNFWLAFLAAGVLSIILGFLVGLISLRTNGHFFAIYTMCVGYIIYLIIDKWDTLTGGVRGLIGIPGPTPIGPITFESLTSQYYLFLFFLILTIFITKRIVHSLLGRTFIAIRNSEELAQTIGISTKKNQLLAFVISCFFAAIAGALYASFVRFIGPEVGAIFLGFEMLIYLVIGGLGTLSGPIIGTLLIVFLTQSLQFMQEYKMLLFGPILLIIVIFYPNGIVGAIEGIKRKIRQRRKKPGSNEGYPDVKEVG
ncbi:branched-chain amino acid ABC transporter permease [Oceanobacillus caeni]|uniref:ABC transporter permease n=1 Tax=Oceanobacillus caeni TaxID=405946 RepID=A0ABR5MN55_9BACI|nr:MULTISPECIES: branched-chain amino acid ABC transporter permease [Bacillaceae]KKE79789.1 ABC transporter permease [Bacilli bacterium VT-13-104]PZD89496.1 branched-chain amino acid ABC transporter permease [Bacilli bacterium]KPH78463.1 ABC transporter permease [Oceanobacillus caeni]MBU8789271.1 branched-chain amino acid ABC transporter permease [Oceanobacillus caeni]MCR1832944.1 branched-chain amino acid ABC transporter permease [Oceanobacillus caeni]